MKPVPTDREAGKLREEVEAARPADLPRLARKVQPLDPGPGAPVNDPLYPAVDRWLRVWPIPLPDAAGPGLAATAKSYAPSWLSDATVGEFEAACLAYTAGARRLREEAGELRAEIARLDAMHANLTLYLELFDLLEPGVAGLAAKDGASFA